MGRDELRPLSFRIAIVVGLFLCSSGAAAGQGLRDIGLKVKSESWVAGSDFDRADFSRSCAAAGLAVRSEPGTQAEAWIDIDYTESKGSGYSPFGVGQPSAFGTNISFRMRLLTNDGAQLLSILLFASTPSKVSGSPHFAAVSDLRSKSGYRFACAAAAAVLGQHAQAEKFLTWAVSDSDGGEVLRSSSFKPSTTSEAAFFAVGRGDWGAVRDLAREATVPLRLFLKSTYHDEGFGQRGLGNDERISAAVQAAAAFVEVARGKDSEIFEGLLKECQGRSYLKPIVLEALRGLGKTGVASSLPSVSQWLTCNKCGYGEAEFQDVSTVAGAAANSIRARIGK